MVTNSKLVEKLNHMDKNENIDKIEDIEDLNAVFDGYDFCYHLAAGVGVQYIMENLSES